LNKKSVMLPMKPAMVAGKTLTRQSRLGPNIFRASDDKELEQSNCERN
jgi:hypothetical protein